MLGCIYLLLEELTLDEVCQLRIIAPCCHLLITGENSLEIVRGTTVQQHVVTQVNQFVFSHKCSMYVLSKPHNISPEISM